MAVSSQALFMDLFHYMEVLYMDTPALYATAWAVLPPLIAIVLALITKEVYSSLFLGVVVGAVLFAGADFDGIVNHVLQDGLIASLSDGWNVGILIFLVILGIIVALMNLSGGSKAFGAWALRRVRTRVTAEVATVLLGIVIFVDDYFNCLTVGSVMKPVTDEFKVSRAKLAYIIDATAAPVCIIAPVSSWAAAVLSASSHRFLPGLLQYRALLAKERASHSS